MNTNHLMEMIEAFAHENGLLWGVCDGEAITDTPQAERLLTTHTDVPFVGETPALVRLSPKLVMPNVQSVIVLGLGYGHGLPPLPESSLQGAFSADAAGQDYHVTLKQLLHQLAETLLQVVPFHYQCQTDNGPLAERPLAHKAGLGAYGRHCSLIAPGEGSFFHVGLLLTSLNLPPSKPQPLLYAGCAHCRRCVDACPAKALSPGDVPACNATTCVSYLTQKKGLLTPNEMDSMGVWLYGCDICRRVCPSNQHKMQTTLQDTAAYFPLLVSVANISPAAFDSQYKHTSAGWRGRQTLRRNALIALGNCGNSQAVPVLESFLHHDSSVLRETAQYGLTKYK